MTTQHVNMNNFNSFRFYFLHNDIILVQIYYIIII